MYRIGYYYENKVVKELKEKGFDAWRTPGSHSPIDIIAIHPVEKKILLIQIKSTSRDFFSISLLPKEERERLKELVQRYKDYPEVSIELWVFFRKSKSKKVYDLKTLHLQ